MDTNVLAFLGDYWAIIVVLLVGAFCPASFKRTAVAYAKKYGVKTMLAAEKRAEQLVLSDGPAKMAWVVDKGYDILPPLVRLTVSKPLFKTLVQDLFDDAVKFAGAHINVVPQQIAEPVVTPDIPVVVTP